MQYSGAFPKSMFLDQLIANTRKELFQECDYTTEREKQLRMRELLADDARYFVPNVIGELSTERVFTSEFASGMTMESSADNLPQSERDEIGLRIMNLTLRELFEWRYMQSDPNPANFIYNDRRRVLNLIDFGATHSYDAKFIDNYIEVVQAGANRDQQKIIDYSVKLGFLTGQENQIMLDTHAESVMTVAEPFREDKEFDFSKQDMTKRAYQLIPVMLKHRIKAPPPEVYSLHRKFSGKSSRSLLRREGGREKLHNNISRVINVGESK